MTKKFLLYLLGIIAIPSVVYAGDLTSTGMNQGDLYTFLNNTKSLVNDLKMRAKTQCLSSAGLQIDTVKAKTSSSVNTYVLVDGSIVILPVDTSVTGVIGTTAVGTATPRQIYVITCNSSGTLTSTEGTQSAGTSTVTLPNIPENQAMVGFVWLLNGSNTSFLPGTHTLNAGSITCTYVNTVGMVDFVPGSGTTNSLSLTGL